MADDPAWADGETEILDDSGRAADVHYRLRVRTDPTSIDDLGFWAPVAHWAMTSLLHHNRPYLVDPLNDKDHVVLETGLNGGSENMQVMRRALSRAFMKTDDRTRRLWVWRENCGLVQVFGHVPKKSRSRVKKTTQRPGSVRIRMRLPDFPGSDHECNGEASTGASRSHRCNIAHASTCGAGGLGRLFLGGLVATVAVMPMICFVDPVITGRTVPITRIAGKTLSDPRAVGNIVLDLFKGAVLFPLAFAFLFVRLPGPAVVKGLAWGAILWLLAQGLLVPALGCGLLGYRGGSVSAAASSLAGYLVYGVLQGLIAGSGMKHG